MRDRGIFAPRFSPKILISLMQQMYFDNKKGRIFLNNEHSTVVNSNKLFCSKGSEIESIKCLCTYSSIVIQLFRYYIPSKLIW